MAKAYVAEGALFRDAPVNDGKTRPVMHVALTVLGVHLDLAVWPKETGRSGTAYWPVTGQYGRNETRRLVDVLPVLGGGTPTEDGPSRSAPEPAGRKAAAPQAEKAGADEDLPF